MTPAPKLSLDANQEVLLEAMYTTLENLFSGGINAGGIGPPNVNLEPSASYNDDTVMGGLPGTTATEMRTQTKQAVIRQLAAVVAHLGGGLSVTVPLAKLTGGGANGSLTFVHGILTARVAPT